MLDIATPSPSLFDPALFAALDDLRRLPDCSGVELDQLACGPFEVRVRFASRDLPLIGRGSLPLDALASLLERQAFFERGWSLDRVDVLRMPIADQGLAPTFRIVRPRGCRPGPFEAFDLLGSDDDLKPFGRVYRETFGVEMRKADIARDAYGAPWWVFDDLKPSARVDAFAKRLNAVGCVIRSPNRDEPEPAMSLRLSPLP